MIEHVRTLYDQFKTKEDENFNAYISQPYLLAAEQDDLIKQLREKKFFDHFSYSSQHGGWACARCGRGENQERAIRNQGINTPAKTTAVAPPKPVNPNNAPSSPGPNKMTAAAPPKPVYSNTPPPASPGTAPKPYSPGPASPTPVTKTTTVAPPKPTPMPTKTLNTVGSTSNFNAPKKPATVKEVFFFDVYIV